LRYSIARLAGDGVCATALPAITAATSEAAATRARCEDSFMPEETGRRGNS
jgi:hypothetical protein